MFIIKSTLKGVPEYDELVAMPTRHAKVDLLLDLERAERCVTSKGETKMHTILEKTDPEVVRRFTSKHLLRTYPDGHRVTSGNYDPVDYWAGGVQMVALNFQTVDQHLVVNNGFFDVQKKSGYILKPPYLRRDGGGGPSTAQVGLQVVAGFQLPGPAQEGGRCLSPKVRVTVIDPMTKPVVWETHEVKDNGFNPVWNTAFQFSVRNRELAQILFEVVHSTTGERVCHHSVPLSAVRQGYRVVTLKDAKTDVSVKHSVLLVNVAVGTEKDA